MIDLVNELKHAYSDVYAPEDVKDKTLEAMKHVSADNVASKPVRRSRKAIRRRRIEWLIAACLCVALVSGGGYTALATSAYVDLDTIPSMEFALNRFGYVRSVTANDGAAQAIIDSSSLVGMSYEQAMETVLGKARASGYLDTGSNVEITVCTGNQTQEDNISQTSAAVLSEGGCECSYNQDSVETREAAQSNGMSTGKYRAFLQLQELGSNITLDECRNATMNQLEALIEASGGQQAHGQQASANNQDSSGHDHSQAQNTGQGNGREGK